MKSLILTSITATWLLAASCVQANEKSIMDKFNELNQASIFTGTSGTNTTVSATEMSRDQAAVIVAQLMNLDTTTPPATTAFGNIPPTHPVSANIKTAAQLSPITSGDTLSTFGPNGTLTLQDLARMLILGIPAPGFTLPTLAGSTLEAMRTGLAEAAHSTSITNTGPPSGNNPPPPKSEVQKKMEELMALLQAKLKQQLEDGQNGEADETRAKMKKLAEEISERQNQRKESTSEKQDDLEKQLEELNEKLQQEKKEREALLAKQRKKTTGNETTPTKEPLSNNKKGQAGLGDPIAAWAHILASINSTPIIDPAVPPSPQLLASLANDIKTIVSLTSPTRDRAGHLTTLLELADNNVGNEITIDNMLAQSIDNTITGAMVGTYTGDLSGELAGGFSGTPVTGIISLTVGLTGKSYFDGNVTFTGTGTGTVELSLLNAGDGSFESTSMKSSDAIISDMSVNALDLKGMFKGSKADGTWDVDLAGTSSSVPGSGTFKAAIK